MVPWLVPVALFWPLAALYLGGGSVEIHGGGGPRQLAGLSLHFAAYLMVYGLLRGGLSGALGPVLGGIVVPIVIASALLPLLARLSFRAFGVRLMSVATSAAE